MKKFDVNGYEKDGQNYVARSLYSFTPANTAQDDWYLAGGHALWTNLTTGAPTASNIRALPFITPDRPLAVLDRLGINVTGAAAGTGIVGIYSNTSDLYLYPSGLINQGYFSTTSTGSKVLAFNIKMSPGTLYWLAYISSSTATMRVPNNGCLASFMGFDNTLGTACAVGWSAALTFPTGMPNTFPLGGALITATPYPAIFYRFAS